MTYFKTKEMKKFKWLNDNTRTFLNRGYLVGNISAEERIMQIAKEAEKILEKNGFAEKFYEYMSNGWYSLSSPVWSNFGLERGLGISCYSSYVGDSVKDIMYTAAEVGMMSKYGGGTSAYFGAIRPRGSEIKNNGKSNGSFPFLKLFDTTIDTISQGSTRRGHFAAYIDIEHEDIEEWLNIQLEGNPIQLIYYGVCVGDEWLKEMIAGDSKKRKIWAKVLQNRAEIGNPYIFFKDNVNNNAPDVYKDKGMKINGSNLCSEIALSTDNDNSFVCCLSSMNLLHYDEWKDTDAVETLTYFLDAVMEEFIKKTENIPFFNRANNFAKQQRALGLGVLGWHDYLMKNSIPFDSFEAMQKNNEIFKLLREKTYSASEQMALEYGEPELLKGYGRRNTTLIAIAPTKSSSFILGQVSQSIEPRKSNYYVDDKAKIEVTYKNPFLKEILVENGKDNDETWMSILHADGSVQHLDFLTDHEKNVFKTFSEISQLSIIQQAAQRQKYIDQSQSLNLTIHPNTPTKDVNKLYLTAWELGVKTLYYQHAINAAQQYSRELLTCSSCEG